MFLLFILLLERVGFIILVAYLLLNISAFKYLLTNRNRWKTRGLLILVFGVFAILSNSTGIEIYQGEVIFGELFSRLSEGSSLANTRVLTIGISGLIGGPVVGISVGAVSSIIRFMQGGIDPYIYVVSSLLIGCVSGVYGQTFIKKESFPSPLQGAVTGAGVEMIQMVCILILSSNVRDAVELVRFIILPMTLINSMGMAVFLSIIHSARKQEMQAKAIQTHDVLKLANATLPYFRSGLDEESCKQAAEVIQKFMKVSAVSITNTKSILAHVGAASDHHKASLDILTDLSREVLKSGEVKEAHSHTEIGCGHPDCPLEAAIVIPLRTERGVVGTLKLYFTDTADLTFVERKIAEGLGNIFSSQIELGEAEEEGRLLQDAEIKSLQAQVNPHFFFNAINTISALIRVDSEQARKLLVRLSQFFRSNLQGARTNLIPLEKELQQVEAYQTLEQARFPDRYTVHVKVEESTKRVLVPPFLLQILVENALKHAFASRKTGNDVWISIEEYTSYIEIEVKDNGFGIPEELKEKIGKEEISSEKGTGSALENLNRRLFHLFGEKSRLQFISTESGTTVRCHIPIQKKES
jgi:two-component system sensor histidine kinase LytS